MKMTLEFHHDLVKRHREQFERARLIHKKHEFNLDKMEKELLTYELKVQFATDHEMVAFDEKELSDVDTTPSKLAGKK